MQRGPLNFDRKRKTMSVNCCLETHSDAEMPQQQQASTCSSLRTDADELQLRRSQKLATLEFDRERKTMRVICCPETNGKVFA